MEHVARPIRWVQQAIGLQLDVSAVVRAVVYRIFIEIFYANLLKNMLYKSNFTVIIEW